MAVVLLCLALLWYRVWLLIQPHGNKMVLFIAVCQIHAEAAKNDAEITDDVTRWLLRCAEYGGFHSDIEFVQQLNL